MKMPAMNHDVTMMDGTDVDTTALTTALTKRQFVNCLATLLPPNVVDIVRALVVIVPAVDGTTVFPQELLAEMLMTRPTGLRSTTRVAMARVYQRLGVGLPSGARDDIAAGRMPAPKQVPSRYDCEGLPLDIMDELLAVAIAISGRHRGGGSANTSGTQIASKIHKYLCVAPADIAPAAQDTGMWEHPKLTSYLEVVAVGKREALKFHVPTNKDLTQALDVASANGRLEMLRWLAHDHFPASFLAHPPAKKGNNKTATFCLQFSKEAMLGAARNGHVHVLEFWTALFAHGVQVGTKVVPVCTAWPQPIFAEAVAGSSMESLVWLLEHLTHHSRSFSMLKDGVMRAAETGNVAMLTRMIEWLRGSNAPAKMREIISDEKVVNGALSSGQVETVQYLSSSGILPSLCANESIRAKVSADLNHLASGKHFAAMEWCLGAGRDLGITLAVSEAAVLQASSAGNVDALTWWGLNLDRFGIVLSPGKCLDFFSSAVSCKDEPVVEWWLSQMKSGVIDVGPEIDSCAASACGVANVASLAWLLQRTKAVGIPFDCSHRVMDEACVWGSTKALQWLLDMLRSGDIPVLRYSAAAIAQASMSGNVEVLKWFAERHVPFMANPDLPMPILHKDVRLYSPRSLDAVAEFWAKYQGALATHIRHPTVFELTCSQWDAAHAHYKSLLRPVQQQAALAGQEVPLSIVACPLFTASATQCPESASTHFYPLDYTSKGEKQSIQGIMDSLPTTTSAAKSVPMAATRSSFAGAAGHNHHHSSD